MNWIDTVSLGLILLLMATGAWAGLIKSIFRLLSIAAASYASWAFSLQVAEYIKPHFEWSPTTIKIAVGSIIFVGTLVVVLLIGNFLSKIIAMTPAGLLDRLGGAGLGLLKASLIILIIGNLLLFIPVKIHSGFGIQLEQSKTLSFIKQFELQPDPPDWDKIKNDGLKKLKNEHIGSKKLIKPSKTKKFDY